MVKAGLESFPFGEKEVGKQHSAFALDLPRFLRPAKRAIPLRVSPEAQRFVGSNLKRLSGFDLGLGTRCLVMNLLASTLTIRYSVPSRLILSSRFILLWPLLSTFLYNFDISTSVGAWSKCETESHTMCMPWLLSLW